MFIGELNRNIKHFEKLFNVKINHRNNIFNFVGDKANVKSIFHFFQKLNDLDDSEYELRLLYLYCMFLGFKGRYYKTEDMKKIEDIYQSQKDLVHDDFPKFAFKRAYAQEQLPSKKRFKTSYKGLWIIVLVSLGIGLVLFIASQNYLNSLLDRYNVF